MAETVQSLKDKGICPTCYNYEHGGIYEDFTHRMLYEDKWLYCFFEEKPRSIGHTIILLKQHYEDMTYIPDEVCKEVYTFAKKTMSALKDVLVVEKVYLCTMCDGAINHFHLQLIPRHWDLATNVSRHHSIRSNSRAFSTASIELFTPNF